MLHATTWIRALFVVVIAAAAITAWAVDAPPQPAVSQWLPASAAQERLEYYLKSCGDDLDEAADYGDEQKEALRRDANALVVVAATLALHDDESPNKAKAAAVAIAAKDLSRANRDHAAASAALEKVTAAWESGAAEPPTWERMASLGALMNEVNVVNARVRRTLSSERNFTRRGEGSLGDLATLAMIANASIYDTHEVKNEEQLPFWFELMSEFRNQATALRQAVEAKDYEAAQEALSGMQTACDECHSEFEVDA